MKALFLNPFSSDAIEVTLTDRHDGNEWLRQVYRLIDTECIDIVQRRIGKKDYEIVCDDEYLLTHSEFVPSYFDETRTLVIYGAIVVCGACDEYGNLTSLTDEDIQNIKLHLITIRELDINSNGELRNRTFLTE